MFSQRTKPSQTSFKCFDDVTKSPTQIPLRYADLACVADSLNCRYSPSAQRLPKACSDIPQFVYPFLIG